MGVYVGPMFNTSPYSKAAWKWKDACHLLADTEDELHELADEIGLKRAWFQAKSVPHYDLTSSMRRKALAAGVQSISRWQEGELIRCWRLSRP